MTNEKDFLAEQFEENRGHLRAVAYRMLGSMTEADDAIQETWLRLSRSDAGEIQNLGGWLTTVVARVCLDMLRARMSRHEEPLEGGGPEPVAARHAAIDPEQEALLADSVGLALLVVLDRLNPAERLAFVLHDLFAISFEEIGSIVGRSPAAARQLASRARRRVQGGDAPASGVPEQRQVVDSFLAAMRAGDLEALVAVLDPDFALRADAIALPGGMPAGVHGARGWAEQALKFGRGARFARLALVDGAVGLVVGPRGRLFRVLRFTVAGGRIVQIEVIGEPARLAELDLAVLH